MVLTILICLIICLILLICFSLIKPENYADSNNNIYLLRAHVLDQITLVAWDKFNKELKNVYLLFDNTKSNMTEDFYNKYEKNIILVTDQKCKNINPLYKNQLITIESSLIIAYNYLIQNSINFDYLWLIESDVYCDGNYKECLNAPVNTDFLATQVQDYYLDNPDWMHWNSIDGELSQLDLNERVRSFFPVTRYNRKFLDIIQSNLGKSSGFCEVYIPTLAKYNNLTYGNINSDLVCHFEWYKVINQETKPNDNNNCLWHKYSEF